ncbi:MAG: hypothetical protein IPK71_09835 [Myxococcales bacterium]|jgi:hypothetical protein|nr:hypothetical protein [Myxococcales bacterium]
MGSYETLGIVFALAGSAALGVGAMALSQASDVRALVWIVVGAVALRVSSRCVLEGRG